MNEPVEMQAARNKGKPVFVLACGIITAVFLCIALATVAIVGAVLLGFRSMKTTAVYQQAVAQATANSDVIDALGEPIETGLLLSGSINVTNQSGDANLAIPLSGPGGKGTLYVEATRTNGNWDYQVLEVEIEGSSGRIDILPRTGR